MSKISPAQQRKNERDISNLLNTQGSGLQDLNGEDTFFTSIISSPGTQQMKLLYGMRIGTSNIGQIYHIKNKLLAV